MLLIDASHDNAKVVLGEKYYPPEIWKFAAMAKRFPTISPDSLRPKGRWVLEREPDGKPYCFHCSACDGDFHHIGIIVASNFCPNCGADMRED